MGKHTEVGLFALSSARPMASWVFDLSHDLSHERPSMGRFRCFIAHSRMIHHDDFVRLLSLIIGRMVLDDGRRSVRNDAQLRRSLLKSSNNLKYIHHYVAFWQLIRRSLSALVISRSLVGTREYLGSSLELYQRRFTQNRHETWVLQAAYLSFLAVVNFGTI
jgi:hypothetical protein